MNLWNAAVNSWDLLLILAALAVVVWSEYR